LQGRQHEAVAAERDHNIRGLGPDIAITLDQAAPRPLRRQPIAGDEGDALIRMCRTGFRHDKAVSNKRRKPRECDYGQKQ
jgi:hypothetical protein